MPFAFSSHVLFSEQAALPKAKREIAIKAADSQAKKKIYYFNMLRN